MPGPDGAVLHGRVDTFNGIILDADSLPKSTSAFAAGLEQSIGVWRHARRRGIWLKLLVDDVQLIQPARQAGAASAAALVRFVRATLTVAHPATQSHDLSDLRASRI